MSRFTEIMRVFVGNKGPYDYMGYETNYISLMADDYRQHFYFHFHSTVDKYDLFEYQQHWIPQIFIAWMLSHLEKFINWPSNKHIIRNNYNPPYIATSSPGFMLKMQFSENHLYIEWGWNLMRLQSKRSIILWKYQFQQVVDQLNIMSTLIDDNFNAKTLEFRSGLFMKIIGAQTNRQI